jgi:glycosyltransferase involved in cell wall biosynthesis
MHISAFTIVRNEEMLIAKHLAHLASIADEVVCVVQPSTDATLLFAQTVAPMLFKPVRIVQHAPEHLGWEFSLKRATEECKHDWCFALTADETYAGAELDKVAKFGKDKDQNAVAIYRYHAVACNAKEWFKIEQWKPEVRLFHKAALLNFKGDLKLHVGLNVVYNQKAVIAPLPGSRIVEFKPNWHHYKGQLFCKDAGVLNELTQCEEKMPARDLRIGQAFWERMRAEPTNP